MADLNCYCPICHGKVLFHDATNPTDKRTGAPLIPDKLYCPHCEMLVAPEVVPAPAGAEFESAHPEIDAAAENRDRSRQGGSNAGGSQRGDLSDQGGSQWRVDSAEGERNTWSDKD